MDLLLIKSSPEIFLKGLNRGYFERILKENIRKVLKDEEYTFYIDQSRWFIKTENIETVKEKVKKVFGVYEIAHVKQTINDYDSIKELALEAIRLYDKNTTFKVVTKRANKTFPLTSMEVSRKVGGYILENTSGYTVDVKKPDLFLEIEIRQESYIYFTKEKAVGGMPYGVNSKTMLMLSGGIDSPVAGYLMARRGIETHGIYFHSHPYTSEKAKDKVIDLAKILTGYTGEFHLHIIPFTEIQMEIMEKCPEDELTIIMRRFMARCAEELSNRLGIQSLATGESIGQVASQTMESLLVTDDAVDMTIFRPLVTMDKLDIMDIAREIGTYKTSILPFEDCCTIFVPKHPVTRPRAYIIRKSESVLNIKDLVKKAVDNKEEIIL